MTTAQDHHLFEDQPAPEGPALPLEGLRVTEVTTTHSCLDMRVTRKHALSLQKLGAQITIVAPDGPGQRGLPGMKFVEFGGGTGMRDRIRSVRILPKLLRSIPTDVYQCHEPEATLAALSAAKRSDARVTFDSHEFWAAGLCDRLGGVRAKLVAWGVKRLLRYLARRVDYITVVSPVMKQIYDAMRGDGRVELIYNSPLPENFPPADQADRDELLVVHEGLLFPNRGLTQMLEALALARREAKVRLRLLGRFHGQTEEAYRREVPRLGLEGAVEYTGWLEPALVGANMSQAQVGMVALQPSFNNYNGLGNKIFNYMACGLASVVPSGSATADLVEATGAGLAVDVTRPEEIAAAWVRLAREGELRRQLAASGRRAIAETLGWHCMERRLERIFRQLSVPRR